MRMMIADQEKRLTRTIRYMVFVRKIAHLSKDLIVLPVHPKLAKGSLGRISFLIQKTDSQVSAQRHRQISKKAHMGKATIDKRIS